MAAEEPPPLGRILGKVPLEHLPDPGEVRTAPGDRHDREPKLPGEAVEVDHVEPSHQGTVQQEGPQVRDVRGGPDEAQDAIGRIAAVDGDERSSDGLDAAGQRQLDRREGCSDRTPSEGSVVDPDDPEVRSLERTPQRYQRSLDADRTMAAGPSSLRCPACGGLFRAAPPSVGPVPWVPCPHCSRPVALLGARDPPPLFRWEVVPGLYPVPRLPPRRRRDPRRGLAAVLLAAALLAAGIAGALLVEGYDAARPLGVTVSGVVLRSTPFGTLPASGGRVVLTDDSGTERSLTLGAHGEFRFIEIPAGAIQINATLAGYAPQVLVTFVSAIYSAGPTTGLTFVLAPGGPGNTSTDTVSPFLNLAGLIATFGATAVLILGGAVVAAVAARHTYRDGRRPIGIAGGAAVLLAPVAILLTGVAQVAPLLWLASGPLAGLGAYVVAARLTEAVRLGDPPEI